MNKTGPDFKLQSSKWLWKDVNALIRCADNSCKTLIGANRGCKELRSMNALAGKSLILDWESLIVS